MLLALFGALVIAQVPPPVDQPPRLRTELPNGATILVERMPKERQISVHLFASSEGVGDTVVSHGHRHLLEHLVAKGRKGDLDRRLEARGGFLRAQTLRDVMHFEVIVPPDSLGLALDALREVISPLEVTPEAIANEIRVLREELALTDDARRLGATAWELAYGESGLDPLGKVETMESATPEGLETLRKAHFSPSQLTLVIAGPVGLDAATAEGKKLIGASDRGTPACLTDREAGKAARGLSEGFGEARAALVGAFDEPDTVAALAAALAVGSRHGRAFVTYTPSTRKGLVIVGQTEATSGIGKLIDEADIGALFPLGKELAKRWVMNQLRDASGAGYLRGLLLSQGFGKRPESMLQAIENMTPTSFARGMELFREGKGVVVVGTR